MTFQEALKYLEIEEYGDRIFHSNSRGELMHLGDYIWFARHLKPEHVPGFKSRFKLCVEWAEQNWKRPESVFQHMPKMIEEAQKEYERYMANDQ